MTPPDVTSFSALASFLTPGEAQAAIHHDYTYLLSDIRTGAIVGELPFQNVSYESKLSAAGDASASIKVNEDTLKLGVKAITSPGKFALYILRDGRPAWGGIIWKRKYDSEKREVSISASSFESYFYHRLQLTTMGWPPGTDQLDIARWLVTSNGSAAAVNIAVSSALSGKTRSRNMFNYEFKTTGLELEQLSGLIDGFDWNVEVTRDNTGVISRTLQFYYPYAGVSRNVTQLFFEYPGSVTSFTVSEDAANAGNSVWAIGAGEESEQVQANSRDDVQLAAGWPLIELTRSYKSVVIPETLQGHADADQQQYNTPVTVFEVSVSPDRYPQLGSYRLGDWARFKLGDDYMQPPLDAYARITAIAVSVDGATGIETVSLTLGGAEVRTDDDNSGASDYA